jgi:hypothetical protein
VGSWQELFEGDGFIAAWTHATGAESAHEGVAIPAELFAQEPGVAERALVDGVRLAWPAGGQLRRGRRGRLVAPTP